MGKGEDTVEAMTPEQQAAQRLTTGRYVAPSYVHYAQHGWWEREERAKDNAVLAKAYLAQLARQAEAISVDGLKTVGFRKTSNPDFRKPLAHPCGLMWESGAKKNRMHVLVGVATDGDRSDAWYSECQPQPTTMSDVDQLINRFSRGGA